MSIITYPRRPAQAARRFAPCLFALGLLLALLGRGAAALAQCAAPTNLAVSSITGSSAVLTFTPSASAQSYTVSYTSLGTGTVTTVSPNPTGSPVALSGLSPALGYTITIISNCAGGQTAGATISFATRARNDEPCTALALPLSGSSCQPVSTTSAGATTTPANGYSIRGCSGNQNPNDVWYTFTTAASGAASTGATVTVAGQYANQLRIFAASSCTGPFTQLACSVAGAATGPAAPIAIAGLSPGTTYYVAVSQLNQLDPSGPFTICVSDPPACAVPLNVAVGIVTPTTAQLTFSPGPGNTSYVVSYYPTALPGNATTVSPNPTAQPITLTGLQPLTNYTATLMARCGSSGTPVTFTVTFSTGNPQDEPAGAVPLPIAPTCQPQSGTNLNATTTPPNGYANPDCTGTLAAPLDVWYTLTTPAGGAASTGVTITATGSYAHQLRLFSSAGGAAGPFTPLGCSADVLVNVLAPAPPLTVLGLAPATTYYLSVGPYNSGSGGAFSVCATPPVPCPAPIALTASAISQTGATLAWGVPGPVSGTFTVEYGRVGFVPGTGAAGAVLVPGLTGTSYTITSGLAANTAYSFYVTRDCGGAGASLRSGPFSFRTTSLTAPANDDPCGAVALPLSGAACTSPTASTTAGATAVAGYRNGCTVSAASDVWFTFTTAATGPASTGVMLTVAGNRIRTFAVFSGPACTGPLTQVGCSQEIVTNAGLGTPPLALTNLLPNTTYYVVVGSNTSGANPAGPFTICLTDPPACPLPTRVQITGIAYTTADLTFVAAAGASNYTVSVTAQGGVPQTVSATASPVSLTGLLPNTPYSVCIATNCATGQATPVCVSFTTLPSGPPNYLCANAIAVSCGQTIQGTYAGVPQVAYPPSIFGLNYGSAGVYYRFVGTGDSIVASTCNPSTAVRGSVIGVYTGSCSGLVSFKGNGSDPTCGRGPAYSTVGFASIPGAVYYLYITSISGIQLGVFELNVQCIPRPCPAPGTVAIANLTATSATVNFVAATTPTPPLGYTLTATPTGGGAPITATGSASPIALSGLLPNTSYAVAVVANCTVTANSAPSAAVLFSTPLASQQAALAALVGLYPNPAHHSATLTVPAQLLPDGSTALALLDALGRTVRTQALSPNATHDRQLLLDLTGLTPGLYTLRLTTRAGTISKHLAIE